MENLKLIRAFSSKYSFPIADPGTSFWKKSVSLPLGGDLQFVQSGNKLLTMAHPVKNLLSWSTVGQRHFAHPLRGILPAVPLCLPYWLYLGLHTYSTSLSVNDYTSSFFYTQFLLFPFKTELPY